MSSLQKTATDIKLSFGRQVGFGLGEFAGQFFYSFWTSYLSVYYTDIVGLAPAIVSIVFMIAKIWDAINDPMLGNIADRHMHKKFGRYRPWILFGTPILAVLSIIMFRVPNLDSNGLKIAFVTITYILAGMAFTGVNIPYMSMQATLTTNIKSRISLSSMKSVFTCIGTLVMNLIAMPVILWFSKIDTANANGYFGAAILFTLVGVILYYITFATTKEVYYPPQAAVKVDLKTTIKYVFGNKNIIALMISLLLGYLSMFGRLGVAVYYYIYCLGNPAMIGLLMMIPPAAGIIPQYLVPKLNVNKKLLVYIAYAMRAITLVGLFLVDYHNLTAIIILLILHGIFQYDMGITMAYIAPTIDDAEVRTGIRLDATVYAFVNLFLKIASALGSAIGLFIMGAMGYVANAAQTPQGLTGINVATNIVPAIFVALAIIPFIFFKLSPETIEKNTKILNERRAKDAAKAAAETDEAVETSTEEAAEDVKDAVEEVKTEVASEVKENAEE